MMLRTVVITALVYLAAFFVIVAVSSLGATLGSVEVGIVFLLAVAVQVALIKQGRVLSPRK